MSCFKTRKTLCPGVANKTPALNFPATSLFTSLGIILKSRTTANPSIMKTYAVSATFCVAPKPNGSIELVLSALGSSPYTPSRARQRFIPEANVLSSARSTMKCNA